MTDGARANRRGQWLENSVGALLAETYEQVQRSEFLADRADQRPVFAKQFEIGEDIYGKRRRVDFILHHPQRWPDCLVIQCKWQASRGSVEEKYPFEVESINCNSYRTIIVLDGGGYSAGARRWLKGQAGGNNRLLHVLDLGGINRFHSQGKL